MLHAGSLVTMTIQDGFGQLRGLAGTSTDKIGRLRWAIFKTRGKLELVLPSAWHHVDGFLN